MICFITQYTDSSYSIVYLLLRILYISYSWSSRLMDLWHHTPVPVQIHLWIPTAFCFKIKRFSSSVWYQTMRLWNSPVFGLNIKSSWSNACFIWAHLSNLTRSTICLFLYHTKHEVAHVSGFYTAPRLNIHNTRYVIIILMFHCTLH